jgi:predicted RNA-binding Zn-ribbon protein involved in translation (DUF1610 family)
MKGFKMDKEKPQNSAEKESETEKKQVPYQTQFSKSRELSAGTSEIEDEIQIERRETYVEPLTRQVLRNLIESGKKGEIVPFYHPASGFTYGVKILQKGNDPHIYSRDFLENLVRLDILQKSFYGSISACPNCESPAITLHPRCPKCKSHHINKTSLTEHIPCGHIDQRDKYTQDLCPKCGKSLVEGEYRNMGRWYVCKECGERFEHPKFNLICRECNNSFAIEEARVLEVPKFTLNPKRTKEIRQNVASLENISKLLTDLGFKTEMPGSVTGHKSGMRYHFSILAKKQTEGRENVIAVDHEVAEDEVRAPPLILYIYKISEMKVDLPIFIALPKLGETARKIARGHDILIIEGPPEGHDRIAQIKAEIESRINQKNIVQLEPEAVTESAIKSEKAPQVLRRSVVSPDAKRKETPLMGVLRKLKRSKNTECNAEYPSAREETSEETPLRNIVFLLDGSSSMRKGIRELSNFELASKAIATVFTKPNPMPKDDMLSLIIFWDEIIRGFQKEILYENVSMSTYIDPQKLSQFGEPKKNAGTPLWDAVEYAIGFLQCKKGIKIVKLITDAVDFRPPKDNSTISKLENSLIRLDYIVVGSEGNVELGKVVSKYKLGRLFESSNVESLALALRA